MSNFWRNWMTVWCIGIGLFGVTLAAGALEATSEPTRIVFQLLNGPGELNLDSHMRFSLAVLGAVSIGWSITLFAAIQAVNQLDKAASKPIWILVIVSVLTWAAIDTALSIATGFWRNAIPNLVYVLTFLLPVSQSGVLKD
ncbi:hypothetical protein [Leptolyngbya sp. GGD]|uniref:hypothetical protein n=1 Tax=Leptolyngbya sp. GGD TaxID=2997907 RepID=UPI00227AF651|nr:hypothetical protein [Leptolyngbya sp. GGD]MCY6493485.1 hypothetical protein [Leptolyngbya sp. GGD]